MTTEQNAMSDDTRIEQEVSRLLEEQINPALNSHGGYARLVRVENSNVYLELGGGCRGCPGARMTMQRGIEAFLREQVAGIGSVIDATDHGR